MKKPKAFLKIVENKSWLAFFEESGLTFLNLWELCPQILILWRSFARLALFLKLDLMRFWKCNKLVAFSFVAGWEIVREIKLSGDRDKYKAVNCRQICTFSDSQQNVSAVFAFLDDQLKHSTIAFNQVTWFIFCLSSEWNISPTHNQAMHCNAFEDLLKNITEPIIWKHVVEKYVQKICIN